MHGISAWHRRLQKKAVQKTTTARNRSEAGVIQTPTAEDPDQNFSAIFAREKDFFFDFPKNASKRMHMLRQVWLVSDWHYLWKF